MLDYLHLAWFGGQLLFDLAKLGPKIRHGLCADAFLFGVNSIQGIIELVQAYICVRYSMFFGSYIEWYSMFSGRQLYFFKVSNK